jgi:hypothetical protein
MVINRIDNQLRINFTVFVPQHTKFVLRIEIICLFLEDRLSFLIFGEVKILYSLNLKAKIRYRHDKYGKYSYNDVLYTSKIANQIKGSVYWPSVYELVCVQFERVTENGSISFTSFNKSILPLIRWLDEIVVVEIIH